MPERVVVCNTSPLLYLHQVSKLELLSQLYGTVIVPSAVERELRAGQERRIDAPVVADIDWISVRSVREKSGLRISVDLGPGEAEVIALGLELPGSLLILDDRLGRRIARLNGLAFTGMLGVLLRAKQAGLLDSIRPTLEKLETTTMWLPEDLVHSILVEAQEEEDDPSSA
jgi:predicted nucleic acid-binding protein